MKLLNNLILRALTLHVSLAVLALTFPASTFGQEATSPLAGAVPEEQHPAAGEWPDPQYEPGVGRVPLQELQALTAEALDPATVGFAAAATIQPRLREGLTLGPPTATRVITGEPSAAAERRAGALPGGAAPLRRGADVSRLKGMGAVGDMDSEQAAEMMGTTPDPEQAAELERELGAAGMAVAATPESPAQTEKWFIHHPLNFDDVPLAKFSDVVTVVAGDGEVLHVRRRNVPASVDATEPTVSAEAAAGVVRQDAAQDFREGATLEVTEPSLEIWVGPDQRGRLAWTMGVQSESLVAPEARQYWVSAVEPAEVLYYESAIDHQQHSGTVTGTIWEATPLDATMDRPLPNLVVRRQSDGATSATDDAGSYSIPGTGNTTIEAGLTGTPARIENRAGPAITRGQSGSHNDPIDLKFDASGDDELAQDTAFYWINATRDFVESILSVAELKEVPTRVNIDDDCNAFWHRIERSINFFRKTDPSSPGIKCPNTAYLDVIAHEYGHGVDQMKGSIQDGGYSEGFGNSLALLITRQPCVGRNFLGGQCLRNATDVHMWPPASNEGVHARGRRYGQFVWNLIQELGNTRPEDEAYGIAARLVLAAAAANPANIPDAVRLMFIADDDDGNLSNGTPHFTELAAAADSRNLPRPPDPVTALLAGKEHVGYAWANDPAAAQYTPSPTYTHNSTGGPVETRRFGPGRYTVRFAGLGGNGTAGGHVQVTTYGAGSETCKVVSWSSTGPDFTANVQCHDVAGTPADARYMVYALGPRTASAVVAVGGR